MPADDMMIEKLKSLIESRIGWGNSKDWSNQDYVVLSEKIREETGEPISHVTLKRIWGKVKYESLPNTHTLDTLALFIGAENWRTFKMRHADNTTQLTTTPKKSNRFYRPVVVAGLVVAVGVIVFFAVRIFRSKQSLPNSSDYAFSTKKVISQGVPNSVVFDYDAVKAPGDSVMIQQSWDVGLRTTVSKQNHQHTCIYYYPDYFLAKLIVNNRIVKQQPLLITTDGWLSLVEKSPVPVYFEKADAIKNGRMSLPVNLLQSKHINFQPEVPTVLFTNVRDFGEIYADDFVFETSLKNDYREGSAICQLTKIYLLCQGTAIWVPLCNKGCISGIDLLFTKYYASGKQQDLSAFGVDFDDMIKVRIESKNGKASIFINDKLSYQVPGQIQRSKIIGIDYSFQGTGSVDYVRLSNGKLRYDEEF